MALFNNFWEKFLTPNVNNIRAQCGQYSVTYLFTETPRTSKLQLTDGSSRKCKSQRSGSTLQNYGLSSSRKQKVTGRPNRAIVLWKQLQ